MFWVFKADLEKNSWKAVAQFMVFSIARSPEYNSLLFLIEAEVLAMNLGFSYSLRNYHVCSLKLLIWWPSKEEVSYNAGAVFLKLRQLTKPGVLFCTETLFSKAFWTLNIKKNFFLLLQNMKSLFNFIPCYFYVEGYRKEEESDALPHKLYISSDTIIVCIVHIYEQYMLWTV